LDSFQFIQILSRYVAGVVDGILIDIAPDAVADKDNVSYFKVTIAPSKTSISTPEKNILLRPGLSVSAEIVTERRTVLSLLLEPARRFKALSLN